MKILRNTFSVRQAVSPSNLYESLQQVVNETNTSLPDSVANIMERWTTQGGFPVLMVRKQAPTANSLSISQVCENSIFNSI